MKTLCLRRLVNVGEVLQKYGLYAVVLSGALLLASCGGSHNAELRITQCTDQDGTPLGVPVKVMVDGDFFGTWKPGKVLTIPIEVGDETRPVRVVAEATDVDPEAYLFSSIDEYHIERGESKEILLRFFKPYRVTIQAFDRQDNPLRNVDVSVNDTYLGKTNDRGFYDWGIRKVQTLAGQVRAGTPLTFSLTRDNETADTAPILIRRGKFSYDAEAYLDLLEEYPPPPSTRVVLVTSNKPDVLVKFYNPATRERREQRPGSVSLTTEEWQWEVAQSATHYGARGTLGAGTQSRLDITLREIPPLLSVPSTRVVRVTSNPSGVLVKLSHPDRGKREVRTPGNVTLTTEEWRWEVAESTTHYGDQDTFDAGTSRLDITLEPIKTIVELDQPLQPCDDARSDGDFDTARTCYDDIVADTRNAVDLRVDALMSKGMMLLQDNTGAIGYGEAVLAFRAVLELDPSQYPAHNNLALIHMRRHAYDDALFHLDKLHAFTDSYAMSGARRKTIKLEVQYQKGKISYEQFLSETNPGIRREKGRLSRSIWQNFLDLSAPGANAQLQARRTEAQNTLDDIKARMGGDVN